MDLAQVTDELYGLSPEDFRAARDERAGAARASGDKELAKAIAALRRPVVSAWLVNRLAREAAGQMADLVSLGGELRDAQQTLDGDRMRELSTQRRTLVTGLVGQAKRLATQDGRTVSLQVEREVEATLQAALADPDAATAVCAGQLAGPLSYAGIGVGEVAAPARRPGGRGSAAPAARAAPPAKPRPVPAVPATGNAAARREAREAAQREAREAAAAEKREREAAAAQRDLADATGAVTGARAALGDAEQTAASAKAELDAVRQRAEQLDRELAEAIAEQSRATRALREAQRGREAAVRALDAATKRLTKAQATAAKLQNAAADPA